MFYLWLVIAFSQVCLSFIRWNEDSEAEYIFLRTIEPGQCLTTFWMSIKVCCVCCRRKMIILALFRELMTAHCAFFISCQNTIQSFGRHFPRQVQHTILIHSVPQKFQILWYFEIRCECLNCKVTVLCGQNLVEPVTAITTEETSGWNDCCCLQWRPGTEQLYSSWVELLGHSAAQSCLKMGST